MVLSHLLESVAQSRENVTLATRKANRYGYT